MRANALIHETSPYLLQHAHNPVDWMPWGAAAFDRARRLDKPIFLSVGYSTCHWCHVMERESFTDKQVAALLNEYCVPVKVDREERPDVDRVYMAFVQATTGRGGWPMSVWLTPELKPFFGGTYFPPEERWGQPGFKTVLRRLAEAWAGNRAAVLAASEDLVGSLRAAVGPAAAAEPPGMDVLHLGYRQLRAEYDRVNGGFGGAPKFPTPAILAFLLRYHVRTAAPDAREMVLHTLDQMARGGICDQLGGGFHRYAVDERWQVPHFEKMLYDQAQLAGVYLDAGRLTHDARFPAIARHILQYVARDLADGQGRCFSAEDADSPLPGETGAMGEGFFYTWTGAELAAALDPESRELFAFVYGVGQDGNVVHDPHGEFRGRNILAVAHTVAEAAAHFGKPQSRVSELLEHARRRLLDRRCQRPRPFLDDKTLVAWNGLMISAFARAYRTLGETVWLDHARRTADFLRTHLYDPQTGRLARAYRAGVRAGEGYAEDYVFLIEGLLELYEAGFNADDLQWALRLQNQQETLFGDARNGGYFETSARAADMLMRMQDDRDGAMPAANSTAAMNLLRLSVLTDEMRLRDRAGRVCAAFAGRLARAPAAMPAMLSALELYLNGLRQVAIAGRADADDTRVLLAAVNREFLPDTVVRLVDSAADGAESDGLPAYMRDMRPVGGKAAAYVCDKDGCRAPVTAPADLRLMLINHNNRGVYLCRA